MLNIIYVSTSRSLSHDVFLPTSSLTLHQHIILQYRRMLVCIKGFPASVSVSPNHTESLSVSIVEFTHVLAASTFLAYPDSLILCGLWRKRSLQHPWQTRRRFRTSHFGSLQTFRRHSPSPSGASSWMPGKNIFLCCCIFGCVDVVTI